MTAAEALYRVRPEFLGLDAAPAPASFEALRQAVPASATVYLPAPFQTVEVLRAASVLSHARLLGAVDPTKLHLRTPWPAEPLDGRAPDLVIASPKFVPWMFPPAGRQPIWWNDQVAVYAPHGAVAPIMPPPPEPETFPVSVRLSDAHTQDGRLTFTATFDDRAPGQWSGQDWLVVAGDGSPWAIPSDLLADGRTPVAAAWFAGHVGPGVGTSTRTFEFQGPASRLACGIAQESSSRPRRLETFKVPAPGCWPCACGTNGSRRFGDSLPSSRCCRLRSLKLARCRIGSTKTRSPSGLFPRHLRRRAVECQQMRCKCLPGGVPRRDGSRTWNRRVSMSPGGRVSDC